MSSRKNQAKPRERLRVAILSSLLLLQQLLLTLEAETMCLCSVIDDALLEPGVLKGLLGGDAGLGVVDEDLVKKVKELLIEAVGWKDEVLDDIRTGHSIESLNLH
jgi:hypothetical protein